MIVLDANVLLEAHIEGPRHRQTREWLDERLWGTARVGLPWQSLLAFLRISTNPRVYQRPQKLADAWAQVQAWLACEPAWVPEPTERHAEILEQLFAHAPVTGNLIPDAHLAAIAIGHGSTLVSFDGDFARFKGLRWQRPF